MQNKLKYEFGIKDYDPFGMITFGRSWEAGSWYRYGFNGYENTDEIYISHTAIDFGARIYDTRIGNFFSVDPRSNEYPWQSAYAYFTNNPISVVDIEGKGGPSDEYYINTYISGKITFNLQIRDQMQYSFSMGMGLSIGSNIKNVGEFSGVGITFNSVYNGFYKGLHSSFVLSALPYINSEGPPAHEGPMPIRTYNQFTTPTILTSYNHFGILLGQNIEFNLNGNIERRTWIQSVRNENFQFLFYSNQSEIGINSLVYVPIFSDLNNSASGMYFSATGLYGGISYSHDELLPKLKWDDYSNSHDQSNVGITSLSYSYFLDNTTEINFSMNTNGGRIVDLWMHNMWENYSGKRVAIRSSNFSTSTTGGNSFEIK